MHGLPHRRDKLPLDRFILNQMKFGSEQFTFTVKGGMIDKYDIVLITIMDLINQDNVQINNWMAQKILLPNLKQIRVVKNWELSLYKNGKMKVQISHNMQFRHMQILYYNNQSLNPPFLARLIIISRPSIQGCHQICLIPDSNHKSNAIPYHEQVAVSLSFEGHSL